MSLLEVNNLQKIYKSALGTNKVEALKDINFNVEQGDYIAIMGESGSGKSTLLNLIAALDKPTKGSIVLENQNIANISESKMAKFRRENLGFVFQEFNLLDTFTIRDNIYLPLILEGKKHSEIEKLLRPLARNLGIEEILDKYPYEVSGGQKQRAAVARAMITRPPIILADEPTGALDSKSSEDLLNLFTLINRSGQTLLMVTHSIKAASKANKILFIKDGKIYHQLNRGSNSDAQLYEKISDTLTMLTNSRGEE